jgi:hypothetical protein
MHLRQYLMAAALARTSAPEATADAADKSHIPPQGQRLQAKRPKPPRNAGSKPIRLRARVVLTHAWMAR